MAFTPTERARIRSLAGFSARFLQFDDSLERAMDSVGDNTDQSTATAIRARLTEADRIDAAIQAAEARLKAEQVGTIKLNKSEIEQLCDRGRQNIARMCRDFGVESRGDYYGTALPTDQASAVGMIPGMGGYQAQG